MRSTSLRIKFSVFVTSVVLLISLILLVIDYNVRTSMIKESFAQSKSMIIENLAFDASEALETGLFAVIQWKAESIAKNPMVLEIELQDMSGNQLLIVPKLATRNNKGVSEKKDIYSKPSNNALFDSDLKNSDEIQNQKLGVLIVTINQEPLEGQLSNLFTHTLLLLVVAITVGFVCVFIGDLYLTSPISKLSQAVREIIDGNYSYKIHNRSNDEIGKLADLINHTGKVLFENQAERNKIYDLKHSILQIAAHELRTPITSIKTYLDIAMHLSIEGDTAQSVTILKQVFSDIESLDRHVTSILSMSALDNKTLTKKPRPVNVDAMFSVLENQFSIKCLSKQRLLWKCSGVGATKGKYIFDYDLVLIIISNAIDNAIKYTNQGFVNVFYKVDGGSMIVTVHDSGIGMTENELSIARSSPNTFHDNIQRKNDGWGIGMSTIHKFIDFLEGSITIESQKDLGTRVVLRIPIEETENQTKSVICNKDELSELRIKLDEVEENTSTVFNNSSTATRKIKVLAIDNDAQHLQQMASLFSPLLLKRDDVTFESCNSATDAIRLVEDTKYDLLLVDYHMPDVDGLKFLQFMASSDSQCMGAHKILLTADANIPSHTRAEILKYANKIQSKGLTTSDIRNMIRSISLRAIG